MIKIKLGCLPVVSAECPGFLIASWLFEALPVTKVNPIARSAAEIKRGILKA
jgi:hypothetical protein